MKKIIYTLATVALIGLGSCQQEEIPMPDNAFEVPVYDTDGDGNDGGSDPKGDEPPLVGTGG